MNRAALLATTAYLATAAVAGAGDETTIITFDDGWEGWNGPQGITDCESNIEPTGGHPGAHIHSFCVDFGVTWWTDTNDAFLGDLTGSDSVTIGIDVKPEAILSFPAQNPIPRDLVVEFRSTDLAKDDYPWSSVWYTLTTMNTGDDWTSLEVTFDPNATELPEGWGGYGDEDPDTFEPILPEDLTFADIMANVNELAFTTYTPGFFYATSIFEVRVDNIRIESETTPPEIPGDLNGDGEVGVADLLILLDEWGACDDCEDCPADLDDDCTVGVSDLLMLLDNWG